MQRICVFCGSNHGALPEYEAGARRLGQVLARRGLALVFGGSHLGLMGAVADAALEAGGQVIGVIPRVMATREIAHGRLPDLRVVESMHERKALMADLADGFVALPGGAGTMDEFFEIWTWSQIGLHRKPCGLLNVAGYYGHLLAFMDHMVAQRFVRGEHRAQVLVDDDAEALLDRMAGFQPQPAGKWLSLEP
jgi:uncharacterized protein (TIGR00730 family)